MHQINFKNILDFAQRANAVYKNETYIRQHYSKNIHVATLKDINIQYFIEYIPTENRQVISIRGTNNPNNFVQDAEYLQHKSAKLGIYVHHGFDNDASLVYKDIGPHLIKGAKVSVTGHSLGAAIATLLMMYLDYDGFDIEHSFNFGQPKITNQKGVDAYRSLPLTRVVDKNDIVPLVPPITLFDSVHGVYEHLGDEIILLDKENFHYLQEHDAERKSLGSFWRNIGHENLDDHFMKNYLKNIKNKIEKWIEIPLA